MQPHVPSSLLQGPIADRFAGLLFPNFLPDDASLQALPALDDDVAPCSDDSGPGPDHCCRASQPGGDEEYDTDEDDLEVCSDDTGPDPGACCRLSNPGLVAGPADGAGGQGWSFPPQW